MSYTIQQLINYAETFIEYQPLAVGTGNEPAISTANMVQNTILNPPFTWAFNRKVDSTTLVLEPGIQNYTIALTDFGYLEKVATISPTDNSVFECKDVYNTLARGMADANTLKQGRPQACGVLAVTYGTNVTLRFMGVPDKAYAVELVYQKLPVPMTTLTGGTGTLAIPDQFIDVFNNLFLGEAMAIADDARANQYRARGVASLITKSEGLDEMQINAFLEQFWARTGQNQYRTASITQGSQARGV